MDRKDFLKIVGFGAASISMPGSFGLMRWVDKKDPDEQDLQLIEVVLQRLKFMPADHHIIELNRKTYAAPLFRSSIPIETSVEYMPIQQRSELEDELRNSVKYRLAMHAIHGIQGFESHGLPSMLGLYDLIGPEVKPSDDFWVVVTRDRFGERVPINEAGYKQPGELHYTLAAFVTTDPVAANLPPFEV